MLRRQDEHGHRATGITIPRCSVGRRCGQGIQATRDNLLTQTHTRRDQTGRHKTIKRNRATTDAKPNTNAAAVSWPSVPHSTHESNQSTITFILQTHTHAFWYFSTGTQPHVHCTPHRCPWHCQRMTTSWCRANRFHDSPCQWHTQLSKCIARPSNQTVTPQPTYNKTKQRKTKQYTVNKHKRQLTFKIKSKK
jgi:hypothetical protein